VLVEKRRLDARVLQVEVVLAHLVGEQHAFVADGAGRHRRHVELLAVLQPERLDGVPRGLADDVELALQRVGDGNAAAPADEHLADHRLELPRRLGEIGVVDRHVAPAEQRLALVLDRALDLVLAGDARGRIARQEHHADAVLPLGRQLDALLGHLVAEIAVRNLDQQPGAVGELRVPAHRAAMRQVAQHREPLLDDRVRLLALDMRHEADAAGVVLVCGIVQTLGQAHGGTDEYTITALQRQWPRAPAAGRRRRATRRGRSAPAPRSAASPPPPSCRPPSARRGLAAQPPAPPPAGLRAR
jgi:hypothetical protein